MNENLNLAKLLKNVPKGTKFYCSGYGNVELEGIYENTNYPIHFIKESGNKSTVTNKGYFYDSDAKGKCIFFPSKEQKDWKLWAKQNKIDYNTGDFIIHVVNNIMNEDLDLVKLLKDVPKGTKFHCSIFGDVTFDGICDSKSPFPIIFKTEKRSEYSVTTEGKIYESYPNAECVFFPSKDQRDWSIWAKEQEEKKKQLLPIDTPVIVSRRPEFLLRYYCDYDRCFCGGKTSKETRDYTEWDVIIPYDKFDPNNIEESLKHNIVKQII